MRRIFVDDSAQPPAAPDAQAVAAVDSKVGAVASALAQSPQNKVLIEGHCDERGTEEYNRALGERRALSVRDRLVELGVGADRIRTMSLGEDRPADPGFSEDAYQANRRGEFVLLKPKS